MFRPWNSTVPSTRASGTVSCMRLRQRSSVDLPHPDGPMIAVTWPCVTPNVTSRTTRDAPKYASSPCVATTGTGDYRSIAATESEPRARGEMRGEADVEDDAV